MGICCVTQETQTKALGQHRGVGWYGRWDGEGGGWEAQEEGDTHRYTYGWRVLMCGRNQHNMVIILQLKINKLRKKQLWNTKYALCCKIYQRNTQGHSWAQEATTCRVALPRGRGGARLKGWVSFSGGEGGG